MRVSYVSSSGSSPGELFYQCDGPGHKRLTQLEDLYLVPDKVRLKLSFFSSRIFCIVFNSLLLYIHCEESEMHKLACLNVTQQQQSFSGLLSEPTRESRHQNISQPGRAGTRTVGNITLYAPKFGH